MSILPFRHSSSPLLTEVIAGFGKPGNEIPRSLGVNEINGSLHGQRRKSLRGRRDE